MATTYSLAGGTYEYSIFIASAGEDCVTLPAGSTAILYNCICISADGTGLVVASAGVTVKNCICKGSVADASSSVDISATSSHNCFVSGAVPANFGVTGNVIEDPEWFDETNEDFHIPETSPCARVGLDLNLLVDFYGSVVHATLPAIGVAESNISTISLKYYNVIFFDIELDSGTKLVATEDFYYGGNKYIGCVLPQSLGYKQSMNDLFYGISSMTEFEFEMMNIDDGVNDTWDEIAALDEFRGRWVKCGSYSSIDGYHFIGYGKISEIEIGDTVRVSCGGRDTILDTIIPKKVITTDLFHATALDLGKPINICFGHCRDVPLYNIRNDRTNKYYDYLIGYGTIEGLDETPASGLGVKRQDQDLQLVTDTYYIYDGAAWIRGSGGADEAVVYAGYAFIRFLNQEQLGHSGPCQFWADVKGLELGGSIANRNFASCIQHLLNNATWGLNRSIDTTSFALAASTLATANGFYCDGAVTAEQTAEQVLLDLLMPARAYLEIDKDKEFEITVDQVGASAFNAGDNDGHYNNCKATSGLRSLSADQTVSTIKVHYDLRPR